MEAVDGDWSVGRMIIDFRVQKPYITMSQYSTRFITVPFCSFSSFVFSQDVYQLVIRSHASSGPCPADTLRLLFVTFTSFLTFSWPNSCLHVSKGCNVLE